MIRRSWTRCASCWCQNETKREKGQKENRGRALTDSCIATNKNLAEEQKKEQQVVREPYIRWKSVPEFFSCVVLQIRASAVSHVFLLCSALFCAVMLVSYIFLRVFSKEKNELVFIRRKKEANALNERELHVAQFRGKWGYWNKEIEKGRWKIEEGKKGPVKIHQSSAEPKRCSCIGTRRRKDFELKSISFFVFLRLFFRSI